MPCNADVYTNTDTYAEYTINNTLLNIHRGDHRRLYDDSGVRRGGGGGSTHASARDVIAIIGAR